jgi:hypothetical protein
MTDELYELLRAALREHFWRTEPQSCHCGWKRPADYSLSHNDHLARIAADALAAEGVTL